jgi:hypothetical protein
MIEAIFEHPHDEYASRWVEIALPLKYATYDKLMFNDSVGYKLKQSGASALYGVKLPFLPFEKKYVKIREVTADVAPPTTFRYHPLVTDDLNELIPTIVLHDTHEKSMDLIELKQVENNLVRSVWYTRHGNADYQVDTWYTIWEGEPALRIQTQLTFSNHNPDNEYTRPFEYIQWQFGETIWSDFAEAEGFICDEGVLEWSPPTEKVGMNETYRFDGYLICEPKELSLVQEYRPLERTTEGTDKAQPVKEDPLYAYSWSDEDLLTVNSIKATGPIHGVITNWNDHDFLIFGAAPEDFATGSADADEEVKRFEQELMDPGDLYRRRRFAQEFNASTAGSQATFGCTKMGQVVTGLRPRLIRALCFSVADEALRPHHMKEADGTPLRNSKHPNLRTNKRVVHFTSADKLGKTDAAPTKGTAYRDGPEETHVASYLHAYLALTHDYQAEFWLNNIITADLAQARPYNGWISTARGQGRVAQFYANSMLCLPSRSAEIEEIMRLRLDVHLSQWPAQYVIDNYPEREILVSHVMYSRNWLQDMSGNVVASFSPWENAKCAVGHYAWSRATQDTSQVEDSRRIAFANARTVVNAYTKFDKWEVPYALRYYTDSKEGLLPDMTKTNWEVHWGNPYWVDWTLAAVKVYVLLETDHTSDTYQKALQILEDVPPPTNWLYSEWRAC